MNNKSIIFAFGGLALLMGGIAAVYAYQYKQLEKRVSNIEKQNKKHRQDLTAYTAQQVQQQLENERPVIEGFRKNKS